MSSHPEPTAADGPESDGQEDLRVGPLELFSDLVFAFAITQLTTVLVGDRTWAGVGHALLLFGMIWWIYGGYIWLTNAVRPNRPIRKLLLLGAMVGFLMMGLAIPRTFQGDGLVFGIGYLIVVLIHTGLFTQAATASTFGRIVRVAPFNITSAILLILAGELSGAPVTALWVIALGIQILSPFVTRTSGFHIEPGHFVERYGLLVLIVLGESIVATGAGGRRIPLSAAMVVTSVLGLAVTAALWWTYFASDEPEAEEALRTTPEERRPVRALASFFYAQIPMLLGIVAIAAAIRTALPHPTSVATESQAFLLAGGAAAFLAGDQCFRLALGLPRAGWRLLAVPVVLATVAVGMTASIVMQIGLLAAVLIGALAAELPHVQSPFHRRSAPTRTTSLGR
jgi:low temperature requirement protein LtrA